MASCRGSISCAFGLARVGPSRCCPLDRGPSTPSGLAEASGPYLVKLEQGEWLDVIVWDGDEAATESFSAGADLPEVVGYVDYMSEVLGEERGVLIDGDLLGG